MEVLVRLSGKGFGMVKRNGEEDRSEGFPEWHLSRKRGGIERYACVPSIPGRRNKFRV